MLQQPTGQNLSLPKVSLVIILSDLKLCSGEENQSKHIGELHFKNKKKILRPVVAMFASHS